MDVPIVSLDESGKGVDILTGYVRPKCFLGMLNDVNLICLFQEKELFLKISGKNLKIVCDPFLFVQKKRPLKTLRADTLLVIKKSAKID